MRSDKFWLLFFKFLFVISSFILNIQLVKLLGEESSGLFFHFISLVNVLGVVCVFGMNTLFLKRFSRKGDNFNKYILISLIIITVNVSILSVVFIALKVDNDFYEKYLLIMVVCFSLVSLVSSALQGAERPLLSFFIFDGGVQLLLLIYIFIIGIGNVTEVAVTQIAIMLIFSIIGMGVLFFLIRGYNLNDRRKPKIIEVYKEAFPIFITQSLNQFIVQSGVLFVGFYLAFKEVAVFAMLYKFSLLFSHAYVTLNRLVYPKIAKFNIFKDKAMVQKMLDNSNSIIYVITFLKCVGFYFVYPYIIDFLGEGFSGYGYIMVILIIAQLTKVFFGPSTVLLQMIDKDLVARNISFISFAICVLLNVTLIPNFGLVGAAVSVVFSFLASGLLSSIFIYKYYKIKTFKFIGTK
ncbi:hypothetical protein EXT47_14245 [Pseudoalteromonas sp. CO342X]|nr:hypothetical protein EXT47_14245 [Pseudoalteromonas sp. CO342X]